MIKIEKIRDYIKFMKTPKAKWDRAVHSDALELLERVLDDNYKPKEVASFAELKKLMLRGAENWKRFCTGGFGLISNEEIAEHYATPSEIKSRRHSDGELGNPNSREDWMDLQARGLFQAEELIKSAFYDLEWRNK